jgi:serine/threonine protein phosphatase PrpC
VLQACPACQAVVAEGDKFCEECGADLAASGGLAASGDPAESGGLVVHIDEPDLAAAPGKCAECGGQVAPDGYCGECGTPAPLPRDHWLEQPASWVAAMCDRGVRHPHNEDAVAVAAGQAPGSFAALVVCDGVSSSTGSDVASLAAVLAARDILVAAAVPKPQRGGAGVESSTLAAAATPVAAAPAGPARIVDPDEAGDPTADPTAPDGVAPDPTAPDGVAPDPTAPDGVAPDGVAPDGVAPGPALGSGSIQARAGMLAARIVEAGLQANAAVVTSAGDPPRPNPPSCTFVAAVLEGDLLVTGWAGDSRAYWLPDARPAVQLSADDSWAGEAIAAGIPREVAERAPQAHAITRWFGVDAPDPRAHTAARLVDGSGWVLVCSDGLWNYCSRAAELQGLVALTVQRTGNDPARLASELVAWAKQQGGHDNITVALARVR